MKKNPIILLLISLLFVGFTACKQVDPSPTPTLPAAATAGTADFTKYISIGNSLTAGFANGGLYNAGMAVSYPNLLAQQFAQVGGGTFTQPLFGTGQENGSGFLKLTALPSATNPSPTIVSETSSLGVIGLGADSKTPLLAKYTGSLNNFGIPGLALATTTTVGYGFNNAAGFNQYFERLLGTADATSTYEAFVEANATGTTFFSFWLGNNDALGYATSGGVTPITPTALFTANLKSLLDKMGTAKGVIVNIGNVTSAAFFTTVTLASLQAAVEAATGTANMDIYITPGTGSVRAATAEDLFLLGSQTQYGSLGSTTTGAGAPFPYGLHPNNPLETQHVLDKDEVTAANTAVTAFNAALQAEATARSLAFVDMNSVLATAASSTGLTDAAGGLTYTTSYITGGIFGLDGIHITAAGNALVANEIIKAVNTTYGATVPLLNPSLYQAVVLSQ
ncbi:MAG TPA: hypothetical protein DCS93_29785 [Microscillaceae bacterium]|nr:hypothetical protein [Microscillaceae bacterium]